MCNECGNCEVFCPYSSAPYLDKFTLYACEEDFNNSTNDGFLLRENGTVFVRLDDVTTVNREGSRLPADIWRLIEACVEKLRWWVM